jgi:hypothetical protein
MSRKSELTDEQIAACRILENIEQFKPRCIDKDDLKARKQKKSAN